jgi:hypothetical protein
MKEYQATKANKKFKKFVRGDIPGYLDEGS